MSDKPSSLLMNLALLPFAFLGILMLGTCALCTAAVVAPSAPDSAEVGR